MMSWRSTVLCFGHLSRGLLRLQRIAAFACSTNRALSKVQNDQSVLGARLRARSHRVAASCACPTVVRSRTSVNGSLVLARLPALRRRQQSSLLLAALVPVVALLVRLFTHRGLTRASRGPPASRACRYPVGFAAGRPLKLNVRPPRTSVHMPFLSASGYPPLSSSAHYGRGMRQFVPSWLRPRVLPLASLARRYSGMHMSSVAQHRRVLRQAPAVLCTPQHLSPSTLWLSFRRCYRRHALSRSTHCASWQPSAWAVGAPFLVSCSWRLAFSLRGARGFALTFPVPFPLFFFASASAPNGRFEGTAGKQGLPVPSGLRPPAAPQARR
jgi:hypothetical protein